MPAGTGKTETIAAITSQAAAVGERALILTHTNAGVDALRGRTRRLGVRPVAVRIDTIASWSHHLVRQYPRLAGITVADEPDWSESCTYYDGAARVLQAPALRTVLAATYQFAIIDEYQDCTASQHAVVTEVAAAIPIAIFGDPLQAIFGWDKTDPLPSWSDQVQQLWPALDLDTYAWRWHDHNQQLGQWLLDIRADFDKGRPIPINQEGPARWVRSEGYGVAARTCRSLRNEFPNDSIVAIGAWENECHNVARSLTGSYTIMETIEGKEMVTFAKTIDGGDPAEIAAATARWGKRCLTGVSELIKSTDVTKLADGKTITHLRRPGAELAQKTLSELLAGTSPAAVAHALQAIADLPGAANYRHDAWYTVLGALRNSSLSNKPLVDTVTQQRNRTRATGRRPSRTTIARPTLIKGLEYDHAVVLDADRLDAQSLYVALTRACKTLTVISAKPMLDPDWS